MNRHSAARWWVRLALVGGVTVGLLAAWALPVAGQAGEPEPFPGPAATPTATPGPGPAAGTGSAAGGTGPPAGGELDYDQQGLAAFRQQCGPGSGGQAATGGSPSAVEGLMQPTPGGFGGGRQLHCGDRRSQGSAMDAATGGQTAGRKGIPTSNYDIGWSQSSGVGLAFNVVTGGASEEVSRRLWGSLTNGAFQFTKTVVRASMATVEWAFKFEIAGKLAGFANDVARGYYAGLWGADSGSRWNAYTLALFASLAYFGYHLVRGRGVQATGDLAVTYLVAVLFVAFVVSVPNGFGRLVDSTLSATSQLSGAIAATTADAAASTERCPGPPEATTRAAHSEATSCPFLQAVHAGFIERPYDLINWGTSLGEPDDASNELADCAAARDQILQSGPHGTSDKPRFIMGAAGCQAQADFNHDPSVSRFMLASMVAAVAVTVLLLVLLSALTLIGAQLLLVGLVTVMPFAAVAGMLPGGSRQLGWRWVGGLAKVVLTVVALSLFLSLYLVGVDALLDTTEGDPWIVQGGLLGAGTLVMFWVRRRMLLAGKQAGQAVGTRLAAAAPGRSGPGLVAAAESGWRRGGRSHSPVRRRARQGYHQARRVGRWRRRLSPSSSGGGPAAGGGGGSSDDGGGGEQDDG